jgi:hypothetical protein
MKLSLVAVVLAFTGSALALIHADEPVKMRRDGTSTPCAWDHAG